MENGSADGKWERHLAEIARRNGDEERWAELTHYADKKQRECQEIDRRWEEYALQAAKKADPRRAREAEALVNRAHSLISAGRSGTSVKRLFWDALDLAPGSSRAYARAEEGLRMLRESEPESSVRRGGSNYSPKGFRVVRGGKKYMAPKWRTPRRRP